MMSYKIDPMTTIWASVCHYLALKGVAVDATLQLKTGPVLIALLMFAFVLAITATLVIVRRSRTQSLRRFVTLLNEFAESEIAQERQAKLRIVKPDADGKK